MNPREKDLVELEQRFWQSMVDQVTDSALEILAEPALMVSSHGLMKFDHAGYRRMAEKGPLVLRDFELREMDVLFPTPDVAVLTYKVRQTVSSRDQTGGETQDMADTSTWIRQDGEWRCVMHTESPVRGGSSH